MSDESISPGNPLSFPNCIGPIAAVAFVPGQVGYIVAATAEADSARANAAATANAVGIAVTAAAAADPVYLRYSGPVSLTTDQWDAVVTGGEGGLSVDAYYYVDSANAGKLVSTAPSAGGTFKTAVGLAISSTTLLVGQHVPIAN